MWSKYSLVHFKKKDASLVARLSGFSWVAQNWWPLIWIIAIIIIVIIIVILIILISIISTIKTMLYTDYYRHDVFGCAVLAVIGALTQIFTTQVACTFLPNPAAVLRTPQCAAWLEPPFAYKDILHPNIPPDKLQVSSYRDSWVSWDNMFFVKQKKRERSIYNSSGTFTCETENRNVFRYILPWETWHLRTTFTIRRITKDMCSQKEMKSCKRKCSYTSLQRLSSKFMLVLL